MVPKQYFFQFQEFKQKHSLSFIVVSYYIVLYFMVHYESTFRYGFW